MNRISRLTETFKVFEQNEDSDQFQETANAIIGRCQKVQSGQKHYQVGEHSERLILTGWQETAAEDENALRETETLESVVSTKRAQIIRIPKLLDRPYLYLSSDLPRHRSLTSRELRPRSDNRPRKYGEEIGQALEVSITQTGDNMFSLLSLHLTRTPYTSR